MRRIEELLGVPVISTTEGLRLGAVAGVKLALNQAQVCYLYVAAEASSASRLVPWQDVDAVGPDAVLVRTRAGTRTIPASEAVHLPDRVGARPVLTASGRKLGRLVSYAVDETNGRIERFYLCTPGLLGFGRRELQLAPAAVLTFGSDAVIVDETAVHPVSPRASARGEMHRRRGSRSRRKAPVRARDFMM